jgi:GNAT superfamily N-acetyltransferase
MTSLPFTLRDAGPADAAFVDQLEDTCMHHYAAALWTDWQSSIGKYGFEPGRHRIVQVDGQDVGVVDVWRHEDHWQIDKLYLLPEVQGQGIGARLLAMVVEEAKDAGMPVHLNVLTSNPDALRFYQREGFREVSRTAERISMEQA